MPLRQITGNRKSFVDITILLGIIFTAIKGVIAADTADFEWGNPVVICPGTELAYRRPWDRVDDLAFSPDSKTLASCGTHFSGEINDPGVGQIKLWNLQTGKIRTVLAADGANKLAFSPDGKTLVSGHFALNNNGFYDSVIHFWNVASKQQTRQVKWPNRIITSLAISNDGQLLAIGGWGNGKETLRIWGMHKDRDQLFPEKHRINSLAFSPDNKFLVASSSDGMTRIWDAQDGSLMQNIAAKGANCVAAISPQVTHPLVAISFGEWSNEVVVWSLLERRQTQILKGYKRCIGCMAFSSDGGLLAVGAKNAGPPPPANSTESETAVATPDSTAPLIVWDVQKGVKVASIPGHIDAITQVAFSPSGTYFVSVDVTGTVRLWKAEVGAGKRDIESAGQNRQGVADERAVRERASDPSRP